MAAARDDARDARRAPGRARGDEGGGEASEESGRAVDGGRRVRSGAFAGAVRRAVK